MASSVRGSPTILAVTSLFLSSDAFSLAASLERNYPSYTARHLDVVYLLPVISLGRLPLTPRLGQGPHISLVDSRVVIPVSLSSQPVRAGAGTRFHAPLASA